MNDGSGVSASADLRRSAVACRTVISARGRDDLLLADLGGVLAGDDVVEAPRQRSQLFLRERLIQHQRLLQHARLFEDDDKQRQVVVYADQLQPANARLGRVRSGDDGGVAQPCRQDRRRQPCPLFQFAGGLVELVADRLAEVVG